MTGVAGGAGVKFTLARPPIEVAAAEVRYPPNTDVIPRGVGLQFRDRLRQVGYRMDQFELSVTQEFGLEVTPTGGRTSTNVSARGWQMNDTATGLAILLMPSSLSVQTNRYTRWSETLRPVLEAACSALAEVLGVEMRSRVGLRFINRFADPEKHSASDWVGAFDKYLLGSIADGPLVSMVRSGHQQLELDCGNGIRAVLRHGPFLDAAVAHSYSYLLDIDVWNEATEPFDAGETAHLLGVLDKQAAGIFRSLISPQVASERGLVEEREDQIDVHLESTTSPTLDDNAESATTTEGAQ